MSDAPHNNRDDEGVLQAFMVGAVACPRCMQVHIDLVDVHHNIIATGSIEFEQWLDLSEHTTAMILKVIEERRDGGPPPTQ